MVGGATRHGRRRGPKLSGLPVAPAVKCPQKGLHARARAHAREALLLASTCSNMLLSDLIT